MNFISKLKSQIYIVQSTFFTRTKNNNFVVCENTVDVISLPPVDLVVAAKLAILYAFLFYVQTRLTKYSESFFFQREEEEEHYRLPGGIYTTAKPRPNAYIPDDDSELPIPRPYGSLAPFKPTEPGSTMRHVRKPVIKPIEIQ